MCSWRSVRITAAERVSAGRATAAAATAGAASVAGAGAAATTGTVTSALAAALRARGAGVVATTGVASVAGAAADFLTIFVFELTVDFEDDISNAVGILLYILTCLNHNLVLALIIAKQNGYGFGRYKIL